MPGMGAVASTFIAGVELIRRGLGDPIGSLTQLGTIRLGKRTDNRTPKINEFVPLANLNDLVFGGWDIFEDNVYQAAQRARVLEEPLLERVKAPLEAIHPMKAVFDHDYVRRIDGPNKKAGANKRELAEALRADIREFKEKNGCSRLVMIWCGSTEVF
ncbi:MAG: inositol-3-phosphate synthase, partial [Bryobacteraceae bacterium]